MFTSISNQPDHSERILQSPESHTISFDDAVNFRKRLSAKLAQLGELRISAAATGGLASYSEEWVRSNVIDRSKKLVLTFEHSGVNIGQVQKHGFEMNIRALAQLWLSSPRAAFESIYVASGATQEDINKWHLALEPVSQVIDSWYK